MAASLNVAQQFSAPVSLYKPVSKQARSCLNHYLGTNLGYLGVLPRSKTVIRVLDRV